MKVIYKKFPTLIKNSYVPQLPTNFPLHLYKKKKTKTTIITNLQRYYINIVIYYHTEHYSKIIKYIRKTYVT